MLVRQIVKHGCSKVLLGVSTSLLVTSGWGATFHWGEIQGQFDSGLSAGAAWALREADQDLIGTTNGGTGSATTSDDGRLNFENDKTLSKIVKGTHELSLKYGNDGVFVRGKYWYDVELKDEHRQFYDINDDGRNMAARASGATFLDAFLYHNYSADDLPGSIRLGKQVVSWGESTFITGGINSINPIDVSSFRRPGSEIKEGLIPVNMLFLSQTINETLSAEFFYQLQWQETVLDNCGTFFSGSDIVANGCNYSTGGPDLTQSAAAMAALLPFGINLSSQGVKMQRADDIEPGDDGQWGTAVHWIEQNTETDIGAYFINYHSRLAYVSTITGPHTADLGFAADLCGNIGMPLASCAAVLAGPAKSLIGAYRLGTSEYLIEYPEDIRLYGLSFATTLPTGTALSGEISYRPNMPLQINGIDLFGAGLGVAERTPIYSSGAYQIQNNQLIHGYERKEVTQVQVTAVHTFNQVAGADTLTLVGEVGAVGVGGLNAEDGIRFSRDSVFGAGALYPDNHYCTTAVNTDNPQHCNRDGYVTDHAWGYRLRGTFDYPDLMAGINLKPSLSYSHDVDGYSPQPGGAFVEGAKAVSAGLDADYLSSYTISLSYTDYFEGRYNTQKDRDFVALSVGANF